MDTEREYLCIGEDHATNALDLPVGTQIGLQFYKEGTRFAIGEVIGIRAATLTPEVSAALKLELFHNGSAPTKLRLVHTSHRAGVHGWERILSLDERTGQEYLLFQLNEKELNSVKKQLSSLKEEEPVIEELTPKEIAKRLMAVMTDTPRGAKWLSEKAEVEYSDVVVTVLKKLRTAGLVQSVTIEGKGRKWLIQT